MRIWIRVGLGITSLFLVVLLTTVQCTDDTPLPESIYYKNTIERLDALKGQLQNEDGDTLKVGWAKVNLTPPFKTSLAGYGIPEYKTVKDSIWVRTFILSDGRKQIALIATDLLIFPPLVKAFINDHLVNLDLDGIYYSATHTHHSIGNWHPGLVGRLFAGEFNEQVVKWITDQVAQSTRLAQRDLKTCKVGYAAIQADHLVYNRLVKEMGTIDPWLRFLKFEQDSGATAILTTFSAHATTISRQEAIIHRDYPGILVDKIEAFPDVEFAAFMAGAVASQGPKGEGIGNEKAEFIADDLVSQVRLISNAIQPTHTRDLEYLDFPFQLREPHYRITDNLRLRAWVFDWLFGDYQASLSFMRIGNTMLAGAPCDFSGELIAPIETKLRQKDLNLMLTSFNGEYIGYVTKDDWYGLDAYETRTMNWFGPGNGDYLSQLIVGMTEEMEGSSGE